MRKVLGLTLLIATGSALAARAPVEELGAGAPPSYPRATPVAGSPPPQSPSAPASQAVMELHSEMQNLREEVRELRGIVEEQGNELRQLRQRQLDDYQDLDRRLSGGVGAAPAPAPRPETRTPIPFGGPEEDMSDAAEPVYGSTGSASTAVDPAPPASDSPGEYEAYTANYNLLKARKIDEAVAGFKTQVVKFPNGKYTANSYYWLGEIYLLQNNLAEAETAFSAVTTKFPAHRKSPDAKFKLARVYHLQGDKAKAQRLLNEVAGSNSSAAALARAYLAENF